MSAFRKTLLVLVPVLSVVATVLLWSAIGTDGGTVREEIAAEAPISDDSSIKTVDETDIKSRLAAAIAAGGAEAGVVEFQRIVSEDPFSVSICHGMYEYIGREATRLLGRLPEYSTPECQFGFVHGALYARVGMYDTAQELVNEVNPYCMRFARDGRAVLDPRGSCYHGMGHLAAGMFPNDPIAAIDVCGAVEEFAQRMCVDGALMEYGEDELVRAGWMNPGAHDNSDVETEVDVENVISMCERVPQYATVKCYSRLWMFLGPIYMPSPEQGEVVCNTSPTREAYERCHEGFGEFGALVDEKYSAFNWPPSTVAEASEVGRRMAARCELHQEPGLCITGSIVSTIAHLFALEPAEELVPNPCAFMRDSQVAAHCEASMQQARELNWDLQNPEQG